MGTKASVLRAIGISALVVAAFAPTPADAQPLGTFRWQLQPYCNVVTLAVTQNGSVVEIDGTDDQCGGRRVGRRLRNRVRAALLGVLDRRGTPPPQNPRRSARISPRSDCWDSLRQIKGFCVFPALDVEFARLSHPAPQRYVGFSFTVLVRAVNLCCTTIYRC